MNDRFYQRGICLENFSTSLPFDLQGAFLCMLWWGRFLTSRIRNVWSGQGPSSSPNCPALLILEFWFTRKGISNCFTLWGAHLPPASICGMTFWSKSSCNHFLCRGQSSSELLNLVWCLFRFRRALERVSDEPTIPEGQVALTEDGLRLSVQISKC